MAESKMAEFKMDAEFKIAAIIKLTENERVKFFYANGGNQSWQLWVSLRGKTKMAESKLAKLNMAEFKMAAIIKLSQNEWVKVFFVKNGWIQDGCHHQVQSEWMSEVFFCTKWLNPKWQNSRWLPSSSWVRMNEWSFFVQMLGTESCQVYGRGKTKMAESNMANSRWLPSSS